MNSYAPLQAPSPARMLRSARRVRVGSTNPPKIEGVRAALRAVAPAAAVEGTAVESGVPAQPTGFEAIVAGARNRAVAARNATCDLAVGYEDGLVRLPGSRGRVWYNVGCAVVLLGEDEGLGFSSGFAYPPACAERAAARAEPIGDLFDALWQEHRPAAGRAASALSIGNVGKLTDGVLPRAEYTRHAVLCALAPLLQADLYTPVGGAV